MWIKQAFSKIKGSSVYVVEQDINSVFLLLESAIFFYEDSLRGSIEVGLGGIPQPFIGRRTGEHSFEISSTPPHSTMNSFAPDCHVQLTKSEGGTIIHVNFGLRTTRVVLFSVLFLMFIGFVVVAVLFEDTRDSLSSLFLFFPLFTLGGAVFYFLGRKKFLRRMEGVLGMEG